MNRSSISLDTSKYHAWIAALSPARDTLGYRPHQDFLLTGGRLLLSWQNSLRLGRSGDIADAFSQHIAEIDDVLTARLLILGYRLAGRLLMKVAGHTTNAEP